MPTPITRHQQQSPCLRLSEWGPDEVYTHNVNEKEYLAIDDDASSQPSSNNSTSQQPTRTLWIGNLDNTWTLDDLATLFGPFGSIDTIRHLPNKECAFINFNRVEDAIKAKEAVVHQMNHRLGTSLVRVGFGKSDYPLATTTLECEQGPTRALWIGNLPLTITPSTLFTLFSNFGVIESVRILNHKNCGFVNFTNQQDAICAKQALQSKEILGPGSGMIRIGFAKVPSLGKLSQQQQQQYETGINMSTYSDNGVGGSTNEKVMMDPRVLCQTGGDNPTGVLAAMATERHYIMNKLGDDSDGDDTVVLDQSYRSLKYYPTIAPAPEIGQYRTVDIPRLRDIRKLLDNDGYLSEVEVDKMAMECLGDLVELCSGVVAPYLASIGVHKNGTWSAQKIVDTSKLTHQINTVCEHLRPYVPALLLDPFGNYVVQCCLALGPDINQFIFDAIVDNCWEIAQGRFGARAVRATLESPHVTRYQQRYVAATLIQYALLLATNPNGALLLIWLLDTSGIPNRYRILCPHLLPHLSKLCTHKLASLTILKLINQRHEPEARQQILDTLFFSSPPSSLLHEVLMDQVHGVSLIQKILSSSYVALTERQRIADQVKQMLVKHKLVLVQGYKRLLEEINMVMVDSNPSLATTGLAWINQEWAAHYITAATTVIQQQQQQDHTATTYSDDDDDTKTCAIQSPDTNLHL
ncbi:armadillo-type protein [Chlamydoabsidia padenii]|nr:armadillo-type protein [Chlamydoabsidia padenii]